MNIFLSLLKIILKMFLCTILSIFFIGSIFIEMIVVGECIEIIYIAIFSFIMVILTWAIIFLPIKHFNVFYKTLFFITLLWGYMSFPHLFPNIREAWDKNICYDDGYCKEGILYGGKTITKAYCINNGYEWIEKYKSCNLRKSR